VPHTHIMTPDNLIECANVRKLFHEHRCKAGMTQAVLAKMVGRSPKTISAIVNARMRVTIDMGRKLAQIFGVPLVEILPWTASLTVDGDYADIIDDLQDLSDENQRFVRRMVRSLLESQE
jgi:DNA-binding XRE family transcriptional regulator